MRSRKAKPDKGLPAGVAEELRRIAGLAGKRCMNAYIVGGMVRDLILGRPGTDVDITIEGDAIRVARDYAKAVGGRVKGVTRFGTCKVMGGPAGSVDFASTRTERYRRPGALPDIKVYPQIIVDLERRDFAINAMAIQLSSGAYGVLLDPFGGWGDLERGRLTVLHPESFSDDPTRALRGIRFAARYGFRFERHTLGFLKACVADGCMQTISGKRVRRELELIFTEDEVVAGIRLLERLAILRTIATSLGFDAKKMSRLATADRDGRRFCEWAGPGGFDPRTYWFGYLFMGQRSVATRLAVYLNLDRRTRRICIWAARDLGGKAKQLSKLKPPYAYEATRLLAALPPESLALLYTASGRRGRGIIETYVKTWRHVKPALTGADLVRLGMKPGPGVGKMLEDILELKFRGELPTRRAEEAFVRGRTGVKQPGVRS